MFSIQVDCALVRSQTRNSSVKYKRVNPFVFPVLSVDMDADASLFIVIVCLIFIIINII